MPIPIIGHQEEYLVRAYDIDAHKRMTAPALLRLLNEAAMQHVLKLKLSVLDLEPHQIGWVLLRLEIRIHRLPTLNEKIQIRTTPSGFERVFTYRDYYVLDHQGVVIASTASTWILLNTETRRPTRIPSWIVEQMPPFPEADDCLPRPTAKLVPWSTAQYEQNHRVGWYEIDFNWHLSNTHYLGLLFSSIPNTFLRNHFPSLIRIHYQQEAQLEDLLSSQSTAIDGLAFRHRLLRGDTLLAQGESTWQAI